MIEATVYVSFVMLALACIAIFGPLGAIVWLLIYGLFRALCFGLLAIIGDPGEAFSREHRLPPHIPR